MSTCEYKIHVPYENSTKLRINKIDPNGKEIDRFFYKGEEADHLLTFINYVKSKLNMKDQEVNLLKQEVHELKIKVHDHEERIISLEENKVDREEVNTLERTWSKRESELILQIDSLRKKGEEYKKKIEEFSTQHEKLADIISELEIERDKAIVERNEAFEKQRSRSASRVRFS